MPIASRTINQLTKVTINFLLSICQFSSLRENIRREKRELIFVNLSKVQSKSRGFTLIELLIVISIIGILSALTLASFGGAQAKARDGIRKSDLAQMKRALELAKSDCSGSAFYPNNWGNGTAAYTGLGTHLISFNPKYISSVPQDPTTGYGYATTAPVIPDKCPTTAGVISPGGIPGAADYAIWAVLEQGAKDAQGKDSRIKCDLKPVPTSGTPSGLNWANDQYAGYFVICNN